MRLLCHTESFQFETDDQLLWEFHIHHRNDLKSEPFNTLYSLISLSHNKKDSILYEELGDNQTITVEGMTLSYIGNEGPGLTYNGRRIFLL